MKLSGWKTWELLLLKGSIALFVFPCIVLAAATAAGLVLRPLGALLGLAVAEGLDGVLVATMIVQYAVGAVVAVLVCRQVWPEVEPSSAE